MNIHYLLMEVFPFLFVFYLVDGFARVRSFQRIFTSATGNSWSRKLPGWRYVGLLPTTRCHIVPHLPLLVVDDGIFVAQSLRHESVLLPEDQLTYYAFDDISEVSADGGSLHWNGREQVRLHDAAAANSAALQIDDLARTRSEVSAAERWLRPRFDLTALDDRLRHFGKVVRWIDPLTIVLFLLVGGILPICLYTDWLPAPALAPLGWVFLGTYLLLLLAGLFAERSLDHSNRSPLRYLASLLSPITVIHLPIELGKHLLAQFDPALVAARLLPRSKLFELLRRELQLCRVARAEAPSPTTAPYWTTRESVLIELVSELDLSLEEVEGSLRLGDASARKYCPLCEMEYDENASRCADCRVELATVPGQKLS